MHPSIEKYLNSMDIKSSGMIAIKTTFIHQAVRTILIDINELQIIKFPLYSVYPFVSDQIP